MHGIEIAQYLQNYKCHEVDQGHSKELLLSSTSVSLPHFMHGFWRKIFFWLCSINWANVIACLPVLRETLDNMCIVYVINFEINLLFFLKPFFFSTWPKIQDKTLNILRRKRAFTMKSKAFFVNFLGVSVAKNCLRPEAMPLTILAIERGLFCNSI